MLRVGYLLLEINRKDDVQDMVKMITINCKLYKYTIKRSRVYPKLDDLFSTNVYLFLGDNSEYICCTRV